MQKTMFKRKNLGQEARRRGAVSRFIRRIGNGLKIAGLVGTLAFSGCTFESSGMLRPDAGRKDGKADIAFVDATKDARKDMPKLPDKGIVETIADSQGDLTKDMSPDTVPQWWDTSWKYCRVITLTGNFPADYAHLVVLDPASPVSFKHSQANGDLSDLRFIEGACNSANAGKTPLPVWVEKVDSTNGSKVWFKSQTANITTIAMYYGNAGAVNISNGKNVFLLFDSFDGASLDTGEWVCNGTCTVAGGMLKLSNKPSKYPYVYSVKKFGIGHVFSALIAYKGTFTTPNYDAYAGFSDHSVSNYNYLVWVYESSGVKFAEQYDGMTKNKSAKTPSDNLPHVWRIDRDTADAKYYYDGTLTHTLTQNNPIGSYPVIFYILNSGISIEANWVFVRSKVSPEPTNKVGSEETQ